MKFGVVKGVAQKTSGKESALGQTRQSAGFEQFCSVLKSSENLSILDMAGASQANITFITEFGHRISSDDIVGTMQQIFGTDFFESQQAESTAQRFLQQTLTFPEEFFDGALVWDALQFLAPPVLDQAVARLLRVMRPGGIVLAFFNSDEKATRIPIYNYRIQDSKTLLQIPRGGSQPAQYFNNRSLEKLFERASSLKFFLTRDSLREVIVRK
jgi:hypothetical protein